MTEFVNELQLDEGAGDDEMRVYLNRQISVRSSRRNRSIRLKCRVIRATLLLLARGYEAQRRPRMTTLQSF